MTSVRRLKAVGAILTVAAIVAAAHSWGEGPKKPQVKKRPMLADATWNASDSSLSDELACSKFAKNGLITYRTSDGDTLFALQLKPKLEPAPVKPIDYALLIDTSASQAQGPLTAAIGIADLLIKAAKKDDRVSIWTVNIPIATKNLTEGFKSVASLDDFKGAFRSLTDAVPLGDTDLKDGLKRVIAGFEQDPARDRAIVLLGDGMSIHNPIELADRTKLCETMIKNGIVFYSVPLGRNLDPANLHGFATGTGGSVVRVLPKDSLGTTVANLREAIAAPIFYPKSCQFNAEVVESFPTVLPPLRGDSATLVVGRMKAEQPITYTIEGTSGGRDARLTATEKVTDAALDNFFLVSMFEQWKHRKDVPAMSQADRVLAYAYEQNQLTRATLLTEAELAMRQDRLETAKNLFEQVKRLDPTSTESDSGLKLVEKLHSGVLHREELKKQLDRSNRSSLALAQADKNTPPAPPTATEPERMLEEQKQRAAVEEQRVNRVIDDTLREARRLLQTDPDAARDLLKRTYANVRNNPDLSERAHEQFGNRLEMSLRNVDVQGARIKRDRDEQLRILTEQRRRFELENIRVAEDERTTKRLELFSQLMDKARYAEAYKLANSIRQDALANGQDVPKEADAGYKIAINADNLSQFTEMRRRREERWLLTMMSVEHSHLPFPDEPEIRFPDPVFWREITKIRKEKYENFGLTDDDPDTLRKMRDMKKALNKSVNLSKGLDPKPLKEAVEDLQDLYGVPILVDGQAFKADLQQDDVESVTVKLPKMAQVSLATVLRLLTAQVNGTYLVRKDYIDITTSDRAVIEKVIRVYPVADLVIPIPNDFNPRAVSGVLSILGTSPGLGLNLGGPQALGGIGQGLGIGAGLGALGAGLGIGGGGLGALGGGFGGGGGQGILGGGLGVGAGGQVNLGVGGGQLGFGGGQLGQLGNLGGQFGIQGGDQSTILITLIRDVVGTPKDWGRLNVFERVEALGRQGALQGTDDQPEDVLPANKINNLGYYPPSRALVVKGSSRFHSSSSPAPISGKDQGAFLDRKGGDNLAAAPRVKDAKGDGNDQKLAANVKKGKDAIPAAEPDPKKIWQDALVKGVNDPGLIIAVADFLAKAEKFDHVAEFLKADLRQGIVVEPWVYEALALALEASGGSPEEIERARVSGVDLKPQDAQSFVRASKALGELKQYDRAVAMCRQASLLEPNAAASYEEALVYAEMAQDTDAMQWAAGNLLKQDWPTDNQELHTKAAAKLKDLADKLARGQRQADGERMVKSVGSLRERDLVIKLNYDGQADLDLEVREPSGAVCSFMQRQSPGGGTLIGDTIADGGQESYVAAKAFSGEYQVTVRRVWGRPLGGKATLEIIQHQGTPRESRRRQTVAIDRQYVLPVTLEDGRRTESDYLPPASPVARKKPAIQLSSNTAVLNKLRMLSDPDFADSDARMKAGLVTLGFTSTTDTLTPTPQASGATDRTRPITLSDIPTMYLTNGQAAPAISNPYLPGGN
jgi:hypothetical protein